jgi:1,4-alpha-glucan branching enzyme
MTVPQRHDVPPGHIASREQDVPSLFSDFDLYLFGQGKHYRLYEKMGAHPRVVNDVEGVNLAKTAI